MQTSRILEEAFLETMECLARLHDAMNKTHMGYARNLQERGERRAIGQAELAMRDDLQALISVGNYSSLQCRGMNAAISAWRPPVKDNRVRSFPLTGRGGAA